MDIIQGRAAPLLAAEDLEGLDDPSAEGKMRNTTSHTTQTTFLFVVAAGLLFLVGSKVYQQHSKEQARMALSSSALGMTTHHDHPP